MLYLNLIQTNIVKTFKRGGVFFKLLFFAQLSWAHLNWQEHNQTVLGFLTWRVFWSFLKGMHWEETFIVMYACIGRKPFWILIVLSLFNEWVGFAHLEVGVGCKYLSLAQWIKDAFCPVDVRICLTRWVNYCSLKRERKKEMQKLNTLSETGVCLVMIGCFAYAGGTWCTVRSCFLTHRNHSLRTKKIGTFPVFPHPAKIFSGSSQSLGMPVVP